MPAPVWYIIKSLGIICLSSPLQFLATSTLCSHPFGVVEGAVRASSGPFDRWLWLSVYFLVLFSVSYPEVYNRTAVKENTKFMYSSMYLGCNSSR
jgi:hypothetical protein